MRASHVDYRAPAVFDDLLEIFVRTARIGRTSTTFEFAAYRLEDDLLLVTATETLVLVDLDQRRPVEIPAVYRDLIRDFEGRISRRDRGRGDADRPSARPEMWRLRTGAAASCDPSPLSRCSRFPPRVPPSKWGIASPFGWSGPLRRLSSPCAQWFP